jgi:hypothetical protein
LISGSREEARCKFMKRKSAVCGALIGGELMARVPPYPTPCFLVESSDSLEKRQLSENKAAGNGTRVRNFLIAKEMIDSLSVLYCVRSELFQILLKIKKMEVDIIFGVFFGRDGWGKRRR